jgi:hypothetical protein
MRSRSGRSGIRHLARATCVIWSFDTHLSPLEARPSIPKRSRRVLAWRRPLVVIVLRAADLARQQLARAGWTVDSVVSGHPTGICGGKTKQVVLDVSANQLQLSGGAVLFPRCQQAVACLKAYVHRAGVTPRPGDGVEQAFTTLGRPTWSSRCTASSSLRRATVPPPHSSAHRSARSPSSPWASPSATCRVNDVT